MDYEVMDFFRSKVSTSVRRKQSCKSTQMNIRTKSNHFQNQALYSHQFNMTPNVGILMNLSVLWTNLRSQRFLCPVLHWTHLSIAIWCTASLNLAIQVTVMWNLVILNLKTMTMILTMMGFTTILSMMTMPWIIIIHVEYKREKGEIVNFEDKFLLNLHSLKPFLIVITYEVLHWSVLVKRTMNYRNTETRSDIMYHRNHGDWRRNHA